MRVNCVVPGFICDDIAKVDTHMVERYVGKTLLRRAGTSVEMAAMIAFLLSSDASYVTGQVFPVCGGITVHG